MDACNAVEKELDRVAGKFTEIGDYCNTVISDLSILFDEINGVLSEANDGSKINDSQYDSHQINLIHEALQKTNEKLQKISSEHRDLHGNVSKVGKVIDRNFISDFSSTTKTDVFQKDQNMMTLNKVMAKHYCRQGMADVAKKLISECEMPLDVAESIYESEGNFAEIYNIWKDILTYDLTSALQWTSKFSNELKAKNSVLEFKLHRLAFLQILSRGLSAQTEAICYARNNFSRFVDRFEKEIQHLMGALIYLPGGIENSPYRTLLSADTWTEASFIFLKDSCNILGISKNSALSVVINAGCTALPALLSIKQVMLSRQVLGIWSGRDELPIEIDLDAEYRYHSIFACPILRQQTSDDNPPKKLTCGHVISSDALHKLSNGNILKCPYCPVEQNADDAIRIWF